MKTIIDKDFFKKWKNKKVVMHCKTKEEATEFCKIMDEHGLRWWYGISYLDVIKWDNKNTCYNFNRGMFSGIKYYKDNKHIILEFSDYIVEERNMGGNNIRKHNTGNRNTGDCNVGNRNTGYGNTGNRNAGNDNTGYGNTGNRNTGDSNVGHGNIGSRNTGRRNIGDSNVGDWNISSGNTGCFNTIEPKMILFNKPSNLTIREWENSAVCELLDTMPDYVNWVFEEDMTEEEKKANLSYKTTKGYLKELSQEEVFEKRQEWYNNLSDEDKKLIISIPNFNADIFKQCTGIDVNKWRVGKIHYILLFNIG